MELGSAIARQLENQAFNTGSENGNVVFKYNHGSGPPFYSATADRRAVGCTWTMWKTSGHDAFFLMVNFITQTATLTVDSSTLTPEFQQAFAEWRSEAEAGPTVSKRWRRLFRNVRLAGHDRTSRMPCLPTSATDREMERHVQDVNGILPPLTAPRPPAQLTPARVVLRGARDRSRSPRRELRW